MTHHRLSPTAAMSAARSLSAAAAGASLLGVGFLALPWTRYRHGYALFLATGFGAAPAGGLVTAVAAAGVLLGVRAGLSWRPWAIARSRGLIALCWLGALLCAGTACIWAARLGDLVSAHRLGPGGILAMTADAAGFLLAAITASALRHSHRPAEPATEAELDAAHARIVSALTD